jgi:hypothetical protein
MRKIKHFNTVILITIIILVFVFYWFGLRTRQIRKYCSSQAIIGAQNKFKEMAKVSPNSELQQKQTEGDFFYAGDYEFCYKLCLKQYSLEK